MDYRVTHVLSFPRMALNLPTNANAARALCASRLPLG
jgi:hypothetical protein